MRPAPDALLDRIAHAGLPRGAAAQAIERWQAGKSWPDAFEGLAEDLRRRALAAGRARHLATARDCWRWAAAAYQAASFAIHLDPSGYHKYGEILRLRRAARRTYLQAVDLDPSSDTVVLELGDGALSGIMRRPIGGPRAVVVLLNGLDSVCDAEMHSFGDQFLARGAAVLALDVPADFGAAVRHPRHDVTALAPALASRISDLFGWHRGIGVFGVSFGGLLAAQLMAGDDRFGRGVALSPPAWIGPSELATERILVMTACAFDLDTDDLDTVERFCRGINLRELRPPAGRLRVHAARDDAIFDCRHAAAFDAWGRGNVAIDWFEAEHVGTSIFHWLLPEACDWLIDGLAGEPNPLPASGVPADAPHAERSLS